MDPSALSKGLALAPKFPAFLSICGSLLTIIRVLSDAGRRKKTMHRIMVGMGTCDFLVSIWYFAGTWAIPKGTPSMFGVGDTDIFWAAGDENGISCSFAGFFNQFTVATPLYNIMLSIVYLLLSHGWKEARIAKIEWILHTIPVVYALTTSIFAAVGDLYGQVEWTCWLNPEEKDTAIKRNIPLIRWIFLFGIVWVCLVFETIAFGLLYRKMRSIEDTMMNRYMSERRWGKARLSHDDEDIVGEDDISEGIVKEEGIVFTDIVGEDGISEDIVEEEEIVFSDIVVEDGISEDIVEEEEIVFTDILGEDGISEDIVEEEEMIFTQELNIEGNKIASQGNGSEHINSEEVTEKELTVSFQTSDSVDEEEQRAIDFASTNFYGPSRASTLVYDKSKKSFQTSDGVKEKVRRAIDSVNTNSHGPIRTSTLVYAKSEKSFQTSDGVKEKVRWAIDSVNRNSQRTLRTSTFVRAKSKKSFQTSDSVEEEQQQRSSLQRSATTLVVPGIGRINERTISLRQVRKEASRSKKIAIQGLLYVGAFYIAWFFPTASRITELVRDGKNYYTITVLDAAFISLQGFLNFLIYFRPDFVKYRKEHKKDSFLISIRSVVIDGFRTDP